jgi:O-antigen ligase
MGGMTGRTAFAGMAAKRKLGQEPWFWVAAAFLVFIFFTGGSSRGNVLSLPFLRGVAALILVAACFSALREEVRAHRILITFLAITIAAVLVQLVPLPPFIWTHLPHRDLAVAAARSAGLADEWRPISLIPTGTRNAAYSLLVPAAMLAVCLCLTPVHRQRLALVVLALGSGAIVLGMFQIATSPEDTFYLYRLSTKFAPTGFFANPNHNAVFLAALLPLAAFCASRLDGRIGRVRKELIVNVAVVVVVTLTILLAGSRAGLLLAAMAIALMPLARTSASPPMSRPDIVRRASLVFVGVSAIGVVAVLMGRAVALHRIIAIDATGDLRLRVWPIIARETMHYFPAGAGWGSFVETFQTAEPYYLLGPTYLNHAHNDWLEVAIDGGALGVALLAFLTGWWLWSLWRMAGMKRRQSVPGWAGLAIILLLGLSSLVDYPLRTPCLQALFVLAWLWIGDALRANLGSVRIR